jgi:hypothetical protein
MNFWIKKSNEFLDMQHSSNIRGQPEHITITFINTLSLYNRLSVYEHYAREKSILQGTIIYV